MHSVTDIHTDRQTTIILRAVRSSNKNDKNDKNFSSSYAI